MAAVRALMVSDKGRLPAHHRLLTLRYDLLRPPVSTDPSGEESGEGGLSDTPSVASQLVIAAAASAL